MFLVFNLNKINGLNKINKSLCLFVAEVDI